MRSEPQKIERTVQIEVAPGILLEGELSLPFGVLGLVLFAHGSGSSRHSPRNQFVARTLREAGIGTLLFDLLTQDEEALDQYTGHLRFDIALLAQRLAGATEWSENQEDLRELPLGYFGSSTGGAAALVAAAELGPRIGAVVSRGGRPDLAGAALPRVQSPTLLLVGAKDKIVIDLNEEAHRAMHCHREIKIVPNASHLFEEPGTLDQVAHWAAEWFQEHLRARG